MTMRVNTDPPHGYYRYTAGCRCDECKAAKAAYIRNKRAVARQQRAPGRAVEGIQHGIYGYQERQCRCDVCVDTARAVKRRQHQARRVS